jgi:CubicO group peptidase (beta-lactamase class C family)
MPIDVKGTVEPRFAKVRDAFARNFEDLNENGAAVSVYHHGRKVVDLWAGVAGSAASLEWSEDTLVPVFSTTKGATAIAALVLADRGALDLDAPVARYWPEFAAAGKERIPVAMILNHQAGLPVVDAPLTFDDVLAGEPVVRALAAQRPIWELGSRHGYHGLTYGWLVGELVRRVTGTSLGRFFANEVARPLGLDFWIGLPEAEEHRVAPVIDAPPPADPVMIERMSALSDPGSLFWRMGTLNGAIPLGASVANVYNSRRVHAAEWPAANGITTARSLARLYAASMAEVDGIRLFGPKTLGRALEVTSEGMDALLGVRTRFGLGFGRDGGDIRLLGPDSYGHAGAGGSVGFADPPSGIAFGYVMKQMGASLLIDPRAARLFDAVRESIR